MSWNQDLNEAVAMERRALEHYSNLMASASAASSASHTQHNNTTPTSSNDNGSTSGLPPALPPPPRPCRPARRSSRSTGTTGTDDQVLPYSSPGPSQSPITVTGDSASTSSGNDLICFNTPDSVQKAHHELKEYINRIHELNRPPDNLSLMPIKNNNIEISSKYTFTAATSPSIRSVNPLINYPSTISHVQYNYSPNVSSNLNTSWQSNSSKSDVTYRPPDISLNTGNYNYNKNVNSVPKIYPDLESMRISEMSPYDYGQNEIISDSGVSFSSSLSSNFSPSTSTIDAGVRTSVSSNDLASALDIQNNQTSIYGKINSNDSFEKLTNNNIPSSQSWSNIDSKNMSRTPSIASSSKNYNTTQHKPRPHLNIPSPNLIDLGTNIYSGPGSVRVSVLEAFDPLLTDESNDYISTSQCSGSVYDEYDPLDYLYGGSETSKETPTYGTINKRGNESMLSPLPSPPPKSIPPLPNIVKRSSNLNSKLYECVSAIQIRKHDSELVAFLNMVKDIRAFYIHNDKETNPGYVIAVKSQGKYPAGTSIKLIVYHNGHANPVTFTCDVQSTVEHVILHVVCELEGEISCDISAYTLKVWGMNEYLTPGSSLSEYDYVRQSVRLEKDVLFCLQSTREASLARTERDDTRDSFITLEEILPNQAATLPISYQNLSILLETLELELTKLSSMVSGGGSTRTAAAAQAVKAICALLGGVETSQISTSLNTLIQACAQTVDSNIKKPEIVSESGEYCNVTLRQATLKDTIGLHCQKLREAVKNFIAMYCKSNRVDFQMNESQYAHPREGEKPVPLNRLTESALFCVEGVHRPPVNWNHDEFIVHAQIYHGTRPLKGSQITHACSLDTSGFYPRIMFDTWLCMDDITLINLPKESRLVITLSGRTLATPENQNSTTTTEKDKATEARESQEKRDEYDSSSSFIQIENEELGWSAIQLFDYDGILVSGSFILPLWPVCADKRLGPAPDLTDCPPVPHPFIHIEIPSYSNAGVIWSDETENEIYSVNINRHSFEALDGHTKQQLLHLIDQGPYQKMPVECREVLWEKRYYLIGIPEALPLVLLASMNWDASSKLQLMHLLDQWSQPSPYDALHLLLPCFPDEGVRAHAVKWLSLASDDTLIMLMPQLCLALRYERFVGSPLARLLLSRSLESPRFAHRLYWQLVHDIPGNSPQNSSSEFLGISLDNEPLPFGHEPDPNIIAAARWVRRNQVLLRALLVIVGENLAERLLKQQHLVKGLTEIAGSVKNSKESVRNRTLMSGLENLQPLMKSNNISLPLSISQEVYDIDVKSCSYFPSNTLPLKINFVSSDNAIVPAIFKVGDDLRQDTLVLQVMKLMDQLWLKEGLDLRMVTFEAVPTQYKKGMIEMVCSAETLRCIQVEWGLTGSFKDKPIAEWLAKHNPSELEYERAVTNFTASCAGYSVATYLLGICDRHNDNIMLKTSGHLFHIDFGKFLGDAQMFGNFKRDRAPFVLTPDMAYVINGGERPSRKFHHFVELCCTAFNIVRKHQNLILHLFSMMASSGISGVSAAAVGYVRAALLPGQTQAEAAAAFARLIHSALKSRFTPINFFLHNLAQLRSGDQSVASSELLSFMPKTYTMIQEGRLTDVDVLGYEKRYDPEKYYVYVLRIFRENQATPFVLYRSYKHFTELYQKICLHFPLAKVHSLPTGLHVGRSNTKQMAERRFGDVQAFLTSLFQLADEIAHSDLVYTFFHPMLRDQQDLGPQRTKKKNEIQHNNENGVGALKISMQYSAGVLSVLILHAESLPMILPGVPPSTYVKVYLVPDPSKETKRKTRVLKRNCHPSFMEMLEYRLPLEVIRGRDLQATVWHHDPLQENQFLGGIQLPLHSMPLTSETVDWYTLQYIPR